MVLDAGGPDRPEGRRPDVQRERVDLDPPRPELVEERPGEVQARRRRGHRPRRLGVDGLVALAVDHPRRSVAGDVRRERQSAVMLQERQDGAALRLHHPAPGLPELDDAEDAGPAGDREAGPGAHPARRSRQHVPAGRRPRADEEELDLRPARRLARRHAGRDDPRIVEDDAVAGTEEPGQVGEPPVDPRAPPPVDHEQARAVTPLGRLLGDRLRRQGVVEIGNIHGSLV